MTYLQSIEGGAFTVDCTEHFLQNNQMRRSMGAMDQFDCMSINMMKF